MKDPKPLSEVYREAILAEAPRVLSLMDREPFSPTIGCCDRVYWAWKFVDFPGARFQEALCVLAFLYSEEFQGNVYCGNPRLLQWVGQGLRFWTSIQYGDGSFDEAYPFERSLAATAFTTFYVGEAMNFIESSLPEETASEVRAALVKAGTWLCRNDESHGFLSNHLAAAAGALQHVYRISREEKFAERSRYFLRRILDRQSKEGWYDEYGGADPGYQTHGSFYLSRCWQMTGDEELELSLQRSMDFLALFVHPDGSIGGEYASRNTQTYYPAAFEMFADRHASAAWIASQLRPTVMSGAAADLRGVDSYNFFPFLNNTVFAYLACRDREDRDPPDTAEDAGPRRSDELNWFPDAGIARIQRPTYVAYVGLAKGGVLKVFDRRSRQLICNDCGYIGKLQNGRVIASQYQDSERELEVDSERIMVRGRFVETSKPTMTPARFSAFRLFLLSAGRFPALAQWLKRYLVKVLIHRKNELDIEFERSISFGNDSITIRDRIGGPDGSRVANIEHREVFTTIHMGSSRYFIANELNPSAVGGHPSIHGERIVGGVSLERVIPIGSGQPR